MAAPSDPSVRYRFAEPDDAGKLGEVHTRSWQAAYAGLIDEDALAALDPAERADNFRDMLPADRRAERQVTWIVAELDGEIVGHTISQLVPDTGEAWLHVLYLAPEGWGHGIGYTLHGMAMRGLRRFGATTAKLKVLNGNERAISFYERLGWAFTGEELEEDWAGVTVTDQVMHLDLSVDLLEENRDYWNAKAPDYAEWQSWNDTIDWGILGITDEDAGNIFPDMTDKDVLEIGCGTGYVSYWAQLRGARLTIGIDNSPAQLATAVERAASKEVQFPLIQGDGHRLPFADESFDVAINEYGAAIWCDPRVWIPEAARVLRPDGLVWFLGNSVQLMLCAPEFEEQLASPHMLRPQRDMHTFEWLDTNNIDFHVSHGEMIKILTGAGLVIEALHELYAPADAPASNYGLADGTWASQWPIEEVWVARKRAN